MNRATVVLSSNGKSSRTGSTLLIVVALMGMMAFLGFVFYTFAAQERANAITLAEGAKVRTSPAIEPDSLFDFALQTIILGPNESNYQSIHWGGRHSLLANMYGRDNTPWNGEGVNLADDQTQPGLPVVDMSYVGGSSGNQSLLRFVDSPAANGGTLWGNNKSIYLSGAYNPNIHLPAPDTNYNGPDINSLFLSYDGLAIDDTGTTSKRVFIPSYFRPQYFRMFNGVKVVTTPQWYQNSPASQIMRPHPGHVCVNPNDGTPLMKGGTVLPRFVSNLDPANGLPAYTALGLRRPFTSNSFLPETASGGASTGNLGVWNGANPFDVSLDVDTDGDGILDAILMDLGYPPIRRGDGKLVVPLFAINIRDLNGLLNVNATGNLSGNFNFASISGSNQLGFRPTGGGNFTPDNLSKSNQGLSTYEINIQRALTANPTDIATTNPEIARQLATFLYLFDPTATQPGRSIAELANLEWLMLNGGRAQFNLGFAQIASPTQSAIIDIFSGRHGEVSRLRNFLTTFSSTGTLDMARAGQSATSFLTFPPAGTTDDNANYNEGELYNLIRWVNPLDFRGSGQQFQRYSWGPDGQPGVAGVDDDSNFVVDDFTEEGWAGSDDPLTPLYGKMVDLYANGALKWPSYSGYHSLGSVRWGENATTGAYSTKLMIGSRSDSLIDDPTESIIDPVLLSTGYSAATTTNVNNANTSDTVFGPEEMAFLQGSNVDSRLMETRSRLAELMPGNLVASSTASDIRKRLTTVSSDRREFGLATYPIGSLRQTGGIPWETNPQFPPDVSFSGNPNPYRPELFNYLKQNQANLSQISSAVKLNANRFLYWPGTGTQYGFAPLPEQSSVGDVNSTRARQYMARDIYTLLYTLCQGQDTDYRINTPLNPILAKEMAQFAVNYVDALDTDDIITVFNYDSDLSQTGPNPGWNDADATDVVYGVERQSLTIVEGMALRIQKTTTNNNPITIFDDKTSTDDGRRYVYFELQNVSPMNVTLASTGVTAANATTNGDWRVRLQNASGGADLNTLYFLNQGLDAANNNVQTDGSGNKYLTAGQTFTVSSQDGTDKFSNTANGTYRTSDFRMSTAVDGNYNVYVPSARFVGTIDNGIAVPKESTPGNQFPAPNCNLDLVWDSYGAAPALPSNRFYLSNGNATAGSFASPITAAVGGIQFVLERRAADGTPNGTWVQVDKTTTIPVSTVAVPDNATAMATDVTTANASLISYPRTEPILRATQTPSPNMLNKAPSTAGTVWQWQPDRDFGSLAELMLIPLYAPGDLTDGRIANTEFCTVAGTYYPTVAAARFLRPDNPDLTLNGTANPGNRWYRLFDLLEIPNRGHQHAAIQGYAPYAAAATFSYGVTNPLMGTPASFGFNGSVGTTSNLTTPVNSSGNDNFPLPEPFGYPLSYGWPRTHGLINLNTVRHPHVLSALIDDDQLIQDQRYVGGVAPNLYAMDESPSRDWWQRFLIARETRASNRFVDPVTGLYVPGVANGRPFRGFDSVGVNALSNVTDSPLENTLLRSLPSNPTIPMADDATTKPNERRRLFEVGTGAEHHGDPANEVTNNAIHPAARYRILSKLMNNTTTRSNSFAVHVTVQYYEAAEVASDTSGISAVRIGGLLDDAPVHRGFFVIDRTSAIEQMKMLSQNGVTAVTSSTFSFKPNNDKSGLRGNMNGIRWKDLVLFRQTLN